MEAPAAPSITDLPSSAQQVIVSKLSRSDAAAYRLASRQLSGVIKDRADAPLWVVANTFKAQYQQEAQTAAASSSSDTGARWGIGTEEGGSSLTARSLAAAAQGVTAARVLLDSSRSCGAHVWQALFRALLSSSTLKSLVVTEYNTQESPDFSAHAAALLIREDPQYQPDGSYSRSPTPDEWFEILGEAAALTAADCAWLPALVDAANARPHVQPDDAQARQQRQPTTAAASAALPSGKLPLDLTLQLLAPLHEHHAAQLFELQCLRSLAIIQTPDWQGHCRRIPPTVLGVVTLPRLRHLPQLSSLSITVGVSPQASIYHPRAGGVSRDDDDAPSEAVLAYQQLRQLLTTLGPQLTQLHIGTPQIGKMGQLVHFELAAPLAGMPALQDLTIDLGCSLQADAPGDVQLDSGPVNSTSNNNSSSSSGGGGPGGAAAPPQHLTRLVCLDFTADVPRYLLTSAAVRSQLQHLEIFGIAGPHVPSEPITMEDLQIQEQLAGLARPAAPDAKWLAQLEALKQLKLAVHGQQELDAVVAAVGSHLQGLTVTCLQASSGQDRVQLRTVFRGCQQLTSLKILGSQAVLSPAADLSAAAQHLTALRQLNYTGSIEVAPFELQQGMLTPGLQGLTIVAQGHFAICRRGLFSAVPGAFPATLTSLKCTQCSWRWPDPHNRCVGLPWQLLPAGIRELEVDMLWLGVDSTGAFDSRLEALPGHANSSDGGSSSGSGSSVGGKGQGSDSGVQQSSPDHKQPTAAMTPASASSTSLAAQPAAWGPLASAELPCLQSLVVRVCGHRQEDGQGWYGTYLTLDALLEHLSALQSLTHLHIASRRLQYMPGSSLHALRSFQQLKALSLDIAIDTKAKEDSLELLHNVAANLAGATGLRVLRLPHVAQMVPSTLEKLEEQHPNRMLGDPGCLLEGLV